MEKQMEKKGLEYYLSLTYPILLYLAEEGGFVAEIEELPGCFTQGETSDEVLTNIDDARQSWIEVAYEMGRTIPLPRTEVEGFSGRVLLRLTRSLHRRLMHSSRKEGVSLNQYILSLLTERQTEEELITSLREYIKEIKDVPPSYHFIIDSIEGEKDISRESLLLEAQRQVEHFPAVAA